MVPLYILWLIMELFQPPLVEEVLAYSPSSSDFSSRKVLHMAQRLDDIIGDLQVLCGFRDCHIAVTLVIHIDPPFVETHTQLLT